MPSMKRPEVPLLVLVVSADARHRVALTRDIHSREWFPLAVSTWARAAEHGLRRADAIVTDSRALNASGAEDALCQEAASGVLILVVPSGAAVPQWARERVTLASRSEVARLLRQVRV